MIERIAPRCCEARVMRVHATRAPRPSFYAKGALLMHMIKTPDARTRRRNLLLPLTSAIGRLRAHRWRGVRFLCYHSVGRPEELPELERRTPAISVDGFRRHLEFLRDASYQVVSMDRALDLLAGGAAEHGQYICLTFDDGRRDNFVNAWPLLRAAGLSAHFFVSSSLIGATVHHRLADGELVDRYMDADMLRTIVREGGSIGSHAHGHVDLTRLDAAALRSELRESRRLLEDVTGGPIHTHAYPWAVYNRRVLAATRDAGYRYAFGSGAGGTVKLLGPGGRGRLAITRNSLRTGPDAAENYVAMSGGLDFTRLYSLLKLRWRYRIWLTPNQT
jgi:peptidoglycan/xylan/chitin deacetylase (PgdA/CDA1 family)